MMNTEFHDWNEAHTYTEVEKITWLLNAIRTLEEKLKLARDNSNAACRERDEYRQRLQHIYQTVTGR